MIVIIHMKNKLKTFISITIVIIITIVFHYMGWLSSVEGFIHNLIKPGSQTLYNLTISIDDETEDISCEDIGQAYSDLKKEVLKNTSDSIQLELLHQENEELKKELNFIQQTKYRSIGANVIGKNTEPTGKTIIIDRGNSDSIKVGNVVITGEGVLVGKVSQIQENFSIVMLINDSQSKVAAMIMNQDRSIGLVEGGYGISVHMNFIPQNEAVNIGDMIVTSGLEDEVPQGLLIGKVEAVEKEAYQPFQRAVISPVIDLDKISIASIILSEPTPDDDI